MLNTVLDLQVTKLLIIVTKRPSVPLKPTFQCDTVIRCFKFWKRNLIHFSKNPCMALKTHLTLLPLSPFFSCMFNLLPTFLVKPAVGVEVIAL